MNESLAKQLHDLCGRWKNITSLDADALIRGNMNEMEKEMQKLIESNQNQETPNNNT